MQTQRIFLIVLVGALTALAQPSFAWQERPMASEADTPAAPNIAPNLNLSVPDLTTNKQSGTEVRIPGIGTVGVLPKLNFGLELLYGANETNARPDDRSSPSDVQLRGTLKYRF
jgi:hypothetical protein